MISLRTAARAASFAGGAAALLLTATPALAYPNVPAASSGSCDQAVQNVAVGSSPAAVTCTFTFKTAEGTAVASQPFRADVTGATKTGADTQTSASGTATVTLKFAACTAEGSSSATVTGTGGTSPNASSTQAVATVNCGKGTFVVTPHDCSPVGATFNCTFTATLNGAAAAGKKVAFLLDATDDAYLHPTSKQTDASGNFSATVVDSTTGHFTITGSVLGDGTNNGDQAEITK